MNLHRGDFRPDEHAEAVEHPGLQAFVDAARDQATPELTFDAQQLHGAWLEQRRRRRTMLGGLAAAAVLTLVAGSLLSSMGSTTGAGPSATSPAVVAEASDVADEPQARPNPDEPVVAPPSAPPVEVVPPALADTVEVLALAETDGAAEVLGPHRLRLPTGRWSVSSRDTQTVEVVLPSGTIELTTGEVHVAVAADVARVELVRGQVVHLDRDGQPVPPPADAAARPPAPSADELATEAEQHMAAGRTKQAIATLRKLVTTHPRSAAARTGLIDLGRWLTRSGQKDRARCAYGVFLERFPGHALAGDVTAAQRALGSGPECRGLRPRSK